MNPLSAIDLWLQAALSPLYSALLWGTLGGIVSMAIYARCSPQTRLDGMKHQQRQLRKTLRGYDGEMDGLYTLIRQDLGLSLHQIRLIFLPFVISCLPVFAMLFGLYDGYEGKELLHFGPDWAHGFEFAFIVAVVISSLIVKLHFKIH